MKNRGRTLCDFECPLSGQCQNYVVGFDKTKTAHWGIRPYNEVKGKCQGFEAFEPEQEEPTEEEVNALIQKYLNGE